MKSTSLIQSLSLLKLVMTDTLFDIEGTSLAVTEDVPPQHEPQRIPKIFHTIWIDFGKGNEVFPKYERNMREFMAMHSNWMFKNWKENEIIELIKFKHPYFLQVFQSYDAPIKKQDAARYVILDIFGGVYIDHDFIPLRNIEPLLKSYEIVVGNESKDQYCPVGGFFAATNGHPLLSKMIGEMNRPGVAQQFVLDATGPGLVRRMLLSYAREYGSAGIKIYSNKFFYPVPHWNKSELKKFNRSDLRNSFPESYLLQEYDGSWL